MNEPHTYAEWLPLFDRFRAGEDSVIDLLKGGTIEWTNVVAERWMRQAVDCITLRLQTLDKELQTGLDRAYRCGDHFAISNALLLARRRLAPLREFARLPALREEGRRLLESEVNRWADEKQRSLEKSVEKVRHDQGRLLKTIRDHPLTSISETPATPRANPAADSGIPPIRGRRILL